VFTYADTFKRVGKITGINYKVLVSVAYVESGLNPYAVDVDGRAYFFRNRAKAARAIKGYVREYSSVDIGLMQVNYEIWGRYLNLSIRQLLNPKINILIGAFILRHYIRKYGYSWKTIGRYHSAEDWSNYNYRNKVRAIYGILRENRQH
jgi:soluble lytic murein transglycosylase-like protein